MEGYLLVYNKFPLTSVCFRLAIQLQLSRKKIVQIQPILSSFDKKQISTLRLQSVGNVKCWDS